MIELKRYYVYVLKSEADGSWYIGYTEDLEKRIQQHNNGESLYTKRKTPWSIIYYEVSFDKFDAIAREKYLKTGMGRRYLNNRLKNQLNFYRGPSVQNTYHPQLQPCVATKLVYRLPYTLKQCIIYQCRLVQCKGI